MSFPSYNMNPFCFTNGFLPMSPHVTNRDLSHYQTPVAFNSPNLSNQSYSSGYASSDSAFYSPPFTTNIYNYNQIKYQSCTQGSINFNGQQLDNQQSPVGSMQTSKSLKRRQVDQDYNHSIFNIINSQDSQSIVDQALNSIDFEKFQTKPVAKKRKIQVQDGDEQIENFHDKTNELNDSEIDFFSDNDQSSTCDSKKKRVLSKSQRVAANQRERKRMGIMNQSFSNLRQSLPISTGRKRRKMSRLDIVVGAIEYIEYLNELLKGDGPYEINFDAYQNSFLF